MDSPTQNLKQRIDEHIERHRRCTACNLYKKRQCFFSPFGNPKSKLFFVLDKPSNVDIDNRFLMSGPHRSVFEAMIASFGLDTEDVWVSPTILCATPDGKDPKISELKACRPRLEYEIHQVQPDIIVAMGALALKSMVPKNPPKFTETLGRVVETKIQGDLVGYTVPVMVTYSLSYLIRNQDTSPGGLWNKFFTHIGKAVNVNNELAKITRQK